MTSLFVLLKQLVAFMLAIINMFGLKTNTVEVELYANPVSGYTWEYSYDNYGVLTLTDSYYMPDASEILSGGSGTQKYIFRAVGTGTVNVTFEYVNTITKDIASTYVYTYTVDEFGEIILENIQ